MIEKAVRVAMATQEEIQPLITIGHGPYVDSTSCLRVSECSSAFVPNDAPPHGVDVLWRASSRHSRAELDLAIITEPQPNPMLTIVSHYCAALHRAVGRP